MAAVLLAAPARADFNSTFEDTKVALGIGADDFRNNAGPSGAFTSGGNSFNNGFFHDPTYGDFWSGWSVSTMTDTTTAGFGNQYSAITGSGAGGSATYGIGFAFSQGDATIKLKDGYDPVSIDLTNTTYAYLSMLEGDTFAKKFEKGDFLVLTIQGLDDKNGLVGSIDFDLARYLSDTDHPLDHWVTVSLASLAGASTLSFGITSSDVDPKNGTNTPTYFAADNLVIRARSVPEPTAFALVVIGGLAATVQMRRKRASAPTAGR